MKLHQLSTFSTPLFSSRYSGTYEVITRCCVYCERFLQYPAHFHPCCIAACGLGESDPGTGSSDRYFE